MKRFLLIIVVFFLITTQLYGQGLEIGGGGSREFPLAGCDAGTAKLIWDSKASGNATAAGCSGTNVTQGWANFATTQFLENHFYLPSNVVNIAAILLWSSSQTSSTGTWALTAVCTALDSTATIDAAAYGTFWAPSQDTSPGTASRIKTTVGNAIALPSSCTGGNKIMHIKLIWTAGTATSFDGHFLYLMY